MQIWLIDATTKKARQITSQKDGACQPTWSPDGLRLAFVSPCPSKQDTYAGGIIYSISVDTEGNPDQSSLSQLTRGLEGDFAPAWSPDGKQRERIMAFQGRGVSRRCISRRRAC